MSKNVFQDHAECLKELSAELARDAGNGAGTITFAGKTLPAIVGPFTIQQVLRQDGGGFSPSLIGTIIVNKSDLPDNFTFHTGNRLQATAPLCQTRNCQVALIEDCFSFYQFTVADVSQNA